MGISLFIILAVYLMFPSAPAQGVSYSKSCSWVNGREICNEEKNTGNTAMASSSSFSGTGGTSQNTYAGAGNPGGNWQASGQNVNTGDGRGFAGPGGAYAGSGAGGGAYAASGAGFIPGGPGGFIPAVFIPGGARGFAPGGFDPMAFVFGRRR